MKVRYGVFVSSTITDLQKERKLISDLILKSGHFPIQQENFIHGYEEISDVIEKHLRSSDIFLLVLAGRYGSIEPISGLSYTELEFDLARELGKRIIVMVLTDEYILKNSVNPSDLEMNDPRYQKFRNKLLNSSMFVNYVDIGLVVSNVLNGELHSA